MPCVTAWCSPDGGHLHCCLIYPEAPPGGRYKTAFIIRQAMSRRDYYSPVTSIRTTEICFIRVEIKFSGRVLFSGPEGHSSPDASRDEGWAKRTQGEITSRCVPVAAVNELRSLTSCVPFYPRFKNSKFSLDQRQPWVDSEFLYMCWLIQNFVTQTSLGPNSINGAVAKTIQRNIRTYSTVYLHKFKL